MLKKILLPALALGALGAVATSVQAQAYPVSDYVQVSVGQAKADKSNAAKYALSDWSDFGGSTSTNRTDTAYKIAMGIKFNPYLAVEAQYIDLGKESYKGRYSSQYISDSEKLSFKTSGIGANIIFSYPIESFTVFAKTGYHYLKTKASYQTSFSDGYYSDHEKASKNYKKWSPSFGIGASYAMTANLVVVAEYETYKSIGKDLYLDTYSAKHNIDLASIGLRYHF